MLSAALRLPAMDHSSRDPMFSAVDSGVMMSEMIQSGSSRCTLRSRGVRCRCGLVHGDSIRVDVAQQGGEQAAQRQIFTNWVADAIYVQQIMLIAAGAPFLLQPACLVNAKQPL